MQAKPEGKRPSMLVPMIVSNNNKHTMRYYIITNYYSAYELQNQNQNSTV